MSNEERVWVSMRPNGPGDFSDELEDFVSAGRAVAPAAGGDVLDPRAHGTWAASRCVRRDSSRRDRGVPQLLLSRGWPTRSSRRPARGGTSDKRARTGHDLASSTCTARTGRYSAGSVYRPNT